MTNPLIPMTTTEHYREAERLAAVAAKRLSSKDPFAHENAEALTALAQVHATLATCEPRQ